jgi:hypothetical protein
MALPQTGDRPGSAGVAPGLAGVVSTIGWVQVSQPNPMPDQGSVPCSLTLGRVEDGRGSLGHLASPRFPSPLIKPDVRISRIRLSD